MTTKKLMVTALAIALLSSGAVFAQGNDNSNGKGAINNGNNGNGAIASELKWANAGHASAEAFLNANPDSAVGKLAALRDAMQAADDAFEEAGIEPGTEIRAADLIQGDIEELILLLGKPTRTSEEVQAEIDLLLAADGGADVIALNAELATALIYEALLAELEASESLVDVQEAADVVGLGDLSDDAMAALWEMLEN